VLCSASLLERRAWWALNRPENAGLGQEGTRGQPQAPRLRGRGEEAALHPAAAAPRWLFQPGMLIQKQSLGEERSGMAILQGAASPWPGGSGGFLLSPHFSPSQPRVSGWLPSGMAQLDVCRHRDAPAGRGKNAVSPCYLFALLIVRFSPALVTPRDGSRTNPSHCRRARWPGRSGSTVAVTVGLPRHAARISCRVRNMLRFSSPAVVADGYGKQKVVGSSASLNQGGDGQKGRGRGRARGVRGWVLFQSSET